MTGRLVRDPEWKEINQGLTNLTFTIASTHEYRSKAEIKKDVVFLTCQVWNKEADKLRIDLKKGQEVFVSGRLKQERWEKDGVQKERFIVVANTVLYNAAFSTSPQPVEEPQYKEVKSAQRPAYKQPEPKQEEYDLPF